MFDLFRRKTAKDFVAEAKETYGVPEQKPMWTCPPEPEVEKEKPAKIFYRIGVTDNNRVSLQMGYGEITMNSEGVKNLIDQLSVFKKQIEEQENKEEENA